MASGGADELPQRGLRTPVLVVLMAFLLAVSVYGIVAASQQQAADGPQGPPGEPISAAQGLGTPLAAVGRLSGLPEPCTAWVVAVDGASDGPAHAVTAGRCVGIEDPATVIVDEEVSGATLTLRSFAEPGSRPAADPVEVAVTGVAWASMRGVDAAILVLGVDYADLAAQGIRPIPVADTLEGGGQVLVAGVPVEGIAESDRHVWGTRCAVAGVVEVLESPWLWPGMQSSDCDALVGGWVGAPALDATGRAVGVVSTGTIGAERGTDCYAGRPCVVSADGVSVMPATTYLSAVPDPAGCVVGGSLQVGAQCGLTDPEDVVAASAQASTARPGSLVQVSLEGGADVGAVGVLAGEVGAVECSERLGWRTVPVEDGRLAVRMPVVRTFAVICIGGPDSPTPLVIEADATAPDSSAIDLEQTSVDGGVAVVPISDSPRITSFLWAAAPTGSIDCATAEGYSEFAGDPAVFEVADLPVTVCVVGVDVAGNRTAPVAFEVALPGD